MGVAILCLFLIQTGLATNATPGFPATGVAAGQPDLDSELNGSQTLYEELKLETSITLGGDFAVTNQAHLDAIKQAVVDLIGAPATSFSIDFDNSVQGQESGAANSVIITYATFVADENTAAAGVVGGANFNTQVQTAVQSATSAAITVGSSNAVTVKSLVEHEKLPQEYIDLLAAAAAANGGAYPASGCGTDQMVDGYNNGQGINMNYEGTKLKTVAGVTQLEVHVFVPARYHFSHEAATFALTWHDRNTGTSQAACYTNRATYAQCDSTASHGWSSSVHPDNECIYDYTADFDWADIVGGYFRAISQVPDGTSTNYIMTMDAERWTYFEEYSETGRLDWNDPNQGSGAGAQYDQRTNADPTALWDVTAGHTIPANSITIRDERYEFEQIPFVLRFMNTVKVEADLQVGSPLTILKAVVEQDVVEINFNTDAHATSPFDRNPDGAFARVDVTLRTSVQYPYAIAGVGETNTLTPYLTFVSGDTNFHSVTPYRFWRGTNSNLCRNNIKGDKCVQDITYRFFPANCNADATLKIDLFVECNKDKAKTANQNPTDDKGCFIDAIQSAATPAEREASNSHLDFEFSISTGDFCPEIIDEYSVDATLRVYHDELFTDELTWSAASQTGYIRELDDRAGEQNNLIDANGSFVNANSNDVLYFLAEYTTRTQKQGDTLTTNDQEIDFTRATAVYMDVKLPLTTLQYRSTYGTTTTLTIAAQGGDVVGDFDATGNADDTAGDGIDYRIHFCGLAGKKLDPARIQEYNGALDYPSTDCFTADPHQNALLLMDVHPMYDLAAVAGSRGVGEKDIALSLRLDERMIPVNPIAGSGQGATGTYVDTKANGGSDQTNTRLTIEAEVYWKGNKNPTRRRLSTEDIAPEQQMQTITTSPTIFLLNTILSAPEVCTLDESGTSTHDMTLWLTVDEDHCPDKKSVQDWSTKFEYTLGSVLGMKSWNQLKVNEVVTCDSPVECEIILDGHDQRRLMGKRYMRVSFSLDSDQKRSAAFHTQRLQEMVVERNSDLYARELFKHASIKNMKVPQCDSTKSVGSASKLDSGASNFTIFASMLVLFIRLLL